MRMSHDYEFRIKGRVSTELLATFTPLRAEPEQIETVVVGPILDRAELYGVLATLETFGMEIVALRRLPNRDACGTEDDRA
jgi:hypothetical protein